MHFKKRNGQLQRGMLFYLPDWPHPSRVATRADGFGAAPGAGAAVGRVSPAVARRGSPGFTSSLGAESVPHLPPSQMG